MSERKLGANMKRFLAYKVSRDAIPDGGGFAAGLDFLMNPQRMKEVSLKALEWCDQAIAAVKSAPDNPYGDDEETIAGVILAGIDARSNGGGGCECQTTVKE
jgi:hypothetical protein